MKAKEGKQGNMTPIHTRYEKGEGVSDMFWF